MILSDGGESTSGVDGVEAGTGGGVGVSEGAGGDGETPPALGAAELAELPTNAWDGGRCCNIIMVRVVLVTDWAAWGFTKRFSNSSSNCPSSSVNYSTAHGG